MILDEGLPEFRQRKALALRRLRRAEHSRLSCVSPGVSARWTGRPRIRRTERLTSVAFQEVDRLLGPSRAFSPRVSERLQSGEVGIT
jgi:hypothetical protein